jgi:hypothetical protein
MATRTPHIFMKHTFLLPFLASLLVAFSSTFAQNTNFNSGVLPVTATIDFKVNPGMINLKGLGKHQVLEVYQIMSGLELVVDSRVKSVSSLITLQNSSTLTKAEAAKLIERALVTQAGIVITRLDDKRASVTFNDALPITR